MFYRSLSHIVVAYFKGVCTTVVHAPKCIFHFFNEHIKGRYYILCVVFNHSLLDVSQLISHCTIPFLVFILSARPFLAQSQRTCGCAFSNTAFSVECCPTGNEPQRNLSIPKKSMRNAGIRLYKPDKYQLN